MKYSLQIDEQVENIELNESVILKEKLRGRKVGQLITASLDDYKSFLNIFIFSLVILGVYFIDL